MRKFGSLFFILVAMMFQPGSIWLAKSSHLPTPADIVDLRLVSDPQISPDGEQVAFVVTEPADPDHPDKPRNSDIWMVAADGKTPPHKYAASDKSETMPRWSPDARWLAFLSDRGEIFPQAKKEDAEPPKPQLWIMPTDGGEGQQVTDLKGGVVAYSWSKDGKTIAVLARDGPTPEDEARKKKRDDRVYVDHEWKFVRLYLCDPVSHDTKLITRQDFNVSDVEWSFDGRELALLVSSTPDLDEVYWHSKLLVINRQGEMVRTLSERAGDGDWGYSPDGKWVAFQERTPTEITTSLSLVPASGGEVKHVDTDYKGTIFWARWATDSKYLIVESVEGTHAVISGLDTTNGRMKKMFDVQIVTGHDHGFSMNRDASAIAFLHQKAEAPTDVWMIDEENQEKQQLTHMNPQVEEWRLGSVEEISWKSKKDDKTIYGVLIKPPNYDAGKLYPTIAEIHGGPEWAWWMGWHGSWHEWGQLLASHGYVVLLPNPRGSEGQGIAFVEANRDDWGGGDFVDIMSGVDELVEKKIADPNRLGIGGWSYGGFMTSWAVTQTHRFKAAVVGAGVTNLFSFNGTSDITPSFLKSYFLDLPFNRRDAYENHSAMSFVKDVKTPTLVVHGGGDERVPLGQGQEFYHALKQMGVMTEMVVYPREPHGFRERAHQLDLLTRVLAWYDTYLK